MKITFHSSKGILEIRVFKDIKKVTTKVTQMLNAECEKLKQADTGKVFWRRSEAADKVTVKAETSPSK
jgi:hypothetical protein